MSASASAYKLITYNQHRSISSATCDEKYFKQGVGHIEVNMQKMRILWTPVTGIDIRLRLSRVVKETHAARAAHDLPGKLL